MDYWDQQILIIISLQTALSFSNFLEQTSLSYSGTRNAAYDKLFSSQAA